MTTPWPERLGRPTTPVLVEQDGLSEVCAKHVACGRGRARDTQRICILGW